MPEVCIVIPCYNEERRLRGRDLLSFVETHPGMSLCLVNDGSRDGTLALLKQLEAANPDRIFVHDMPANGGKAEAVRSGVMYVAQKKRWSVIGYWDADLSTPLDEADRLLRAMEETPQCQLALGSRVKRLGSHIERRMTRHVMGRIFATCASGILGLAVYDSQCGAKLFRAEVAPVLFGDPFLTRWLFDLEMLARLRDNGGGLDVTCEVPLGRWQEVPGSKMKLRDFLAVPVELLKIRAHYNRRSA